MSSKGAVVEELNSCPSWFETINCVSALAKQPNLGLRLRTSCSADRSAGLNSSALVLTQTKAGMYYRNWRIEGGFLESGSLAGAVTQAPGVLSEFSSRMVDLRSLRSVVNNVVCSF